MIRSGALDVDRLARLSDADFDALGRGLHAWLASQGRRWEFAGIQRFETPPLTDEDRELDDEHRTFVWRDPDRKMHWVLVPGGELTPGYDAVRLRRLTRRLVQMESGTDKADVVLDRDIVPYGAGEGWDFKRLHAKATTRVEPLLISAIPLLQSTPGIVGCIGTKQNRLFGWTRGRRRVLAFHSEEIGPVLETLAARLADDIELQWAMSGGRPTLFPWGDRLPRFMWADEYWLGDDAIEENERNFVATFRHDYEPEAPEWARANRFGVIGPLVASTWCTIDQRLGYLGGAGECFPWQGCGEWAGFLCAAAVVHVADSRQTEAHGLRPVIPLQSFEG